MIAFDIQNAHLFWITCKEFHIKMDSDLERNILLAKLRKTTEQHRNMIHIAQVILQINPRSFDPNQSNVDLN